MKEMVVNGKHYRLPDMLTPFQQEMYIHLIDWKWQHITKEEGYYGNTPYDAILPESVRETYPIIYPDAVGALKQHHSDFPFKLHQHFSHMASSQAANANLFLPILLNQRANEVFRKLKPGFSELATDRLDNGFQIEFWGAEAGPGLLGDHTKLYGTDSDIAIACYNDERELCLWLIEHKLTEREFTECHASTSKGKKAHHDCSRSFSEILENRSYCYYHDVRHFKYWDITEQYRDFFVNHGEYHQCPFRGGMNQLWRNQLLALSVQHDKEQPYQNVYFSVVRHPQNLHLIPTIEAYQHLVGNSERFSTFTSADVVNRAKELDDPGLNKWATWYTELYRLQ